MKHRVLVRHDFEMLRLHLRDHRLRIVPERRLELEVADHAVPAERFAVGREKDQRVARDAPLAQLARKRPHLLGALEVARRLQVPEVPARRHRRPAQQLRHRIHHVTRARGREKVEGGASAFGVIDKLKSAVGPPHRHAGVGAVVEEQRPAAARDHERDADVRAGPAAHVRVPELADPAEPVELLPAVAEAVEVLAHRQPEAQLQSAVSRAGVRVRRDDRGIGQPGLAGGAGEAQAEGLRADRDGEVRRGKRRRVARAQLVAGGSPLPLRQVARPGPEVQAHAHDARLADGDLDSAGRRRVPDRAVAARLERGFVQ